MDRIESVLKPISIPLGFTLSSIWNAALLHNSFPLLYNFQWTSYYTKDSSTDSVNIYTMLLKALISTWSCGMNVSQSDNQTISNQAISKIIDLKLFLNWFWLIVSCQQQDTVRSSTLFLLSFKNVVKFR